jgi:hypothetical protein|tara:strand:+ start:109 stop:603 length:495 start_codon:yes stop_codon:yes gene_type:complete
MKKEQDKLITCPCCNSNACYESEFTTEEGPITTWLCMTCGFTSNSTMTKDSEALEQTLNHTAEMIKDLRQDHNDTAWFPTAITMPNKGMIFPEPIESTDDWGWTVVKAIPIPKEEQEKFPDPQNPGTFYKNKMDMKNLKRYDKLSFMDAAEELGMFAKQEINED